MRFDKFRRQLQTALAAEDMASQVWPSRYGDGIVELLHPKFGRVDLISLKTCPGGKGEAILRIGYTNHIIGLMPGEIPRAVRIIKKFYEELTELFEIQEIMES